MAEALLRVRGLRHGWPGRALFNGLDLDVGPGLTWLVGDEGTGKTTLLALIAGAMQAGAGEMQWLGESLHATMDDGRRRVFWCDPRDPAHDQTPAGELLRQWTTPWPHASTKLRADLVDAFALSPHLGKSMHMLSAGSRRKVGLAAALSAGAPLTLLDQPFAALDPPSTRVVLERLRALAADPQRTCLVADHQAHPALADAPSISLDRP